MTIYKCLKPHQKTVEAWKNAGYKPHDLEVASQEQTLLQGLGKARSEVFQFGIEPDVEKRILVREARETAERPIKRAVTKMHRTEEGNVYYTQTLQGEKWDDKTDLYATQVVGKFDMPTFKVTKDPETSETTKVGIKDINTEFEIPLTDREFTDPSTGEKTTLKDLHKMATKGFIFYVKTYSRTYALRGITIDEFIHRSFADLTYRGKNEVWPPIEAVAEESPKRRVKADEA